ncbi:MAG: hypothetical protein JSS62_03215 [Verrucomicrobia bacterium]|nr:hypothetical protein [Verrucomicrobiota bacterium]MBS0646679.1 hypothetical protein [Verrucomicrobiota bacterium]
MPTYDYTCTACGHHMEVFQNITDPALEQCPHCSKATFQRGIGGGSATFQFKGQGFYLTDYKKSCDGSGSGGCCPCSDKS